MRLFFLRSLLAFSIFGLASEAVATSVIRDAAYWHPEIPKHLAANESREDIAVCKTATIFALANGIGVHSDIYRNSSYGHLDYWQAAGTLIDAQDSHVTLTDAEHKYLMNLVSADETYAFSIQDIMFLARKDMTFFSVSWQYVYDNYYDECETTIQRAISESQSENKAPTE